MIVVIFLSEPARATLVTIGDCNSNEAPGGYWDQDCDAGQNGVMHCTETPIYGGLLSEVACDFERGGAGGAEGWAVSDYSGSDGDRYYSVWGTDGDGEDFCCAVDDTAHEVLWRLRLDGTDEVDELNFSINSRDMHDMAFPELHGFAGDDVLYGSQIWDEYAFGGNGVDTMELFDGDWTGYNGEAHGGAGGDFIYGGADIDWFYGDGGGDTMEGAGGDDYMVGDVGTDILRGENGDDELFGGLDADIVCSGNPGSTGDFLSGANDGGLEGGGADANDKLWVPQSASPGPSGTSQANDDCGYSPTHDGFAGTSCDYSLTVNPGC